MLAESSPGMTSTCTRSMRVARAGALRYRRRTSAHRHIIAALLVLCTPAVSSAQEIKVTLLGTGAPPAEIDRFGPGTLVEAGGELLLFDVGRGVTQRLSQLK